MLKPTLTSAINDFHEARRKASLSDLMRRITGRPSELLPFDEVSQYVRVRGTRLRELKDIPLDAIAGSVGRYEDFNREFLPLQVSDASRWAGVKKAVEAQGLPPIEVYKLDQVFFVVDGNHRVSIARDMGSTHIEAYVTEFDVDVSVGPEDDLEDIVLRAELANFIEDTGLDQHRPQYDFYTTSAGRFRQLRDHINVHRYYLGLELGREPSQEEAVLSWVDRVYGPMLELIRENGLLRDFPERTETDLYLWIMKHRGELTQELGWDIEPTRAAQNLAARFSATPRRVISRVRNRLLDLVTPDELEGGPPPGQWRNETFAPRRQDRLTTSILVPLRGWDQNWLALDQAITVAQRENATVRGLYVVHSPDDLESDEVRQIRDGFEWRINERGVRGKLAVTSGNITDIIVDRATWNELIVMHMHYPPPTQPIARLRSGIRHIMQRSSRPVLAVPDASDLQRPMLAYDGSPKAQEALYLSAYLIERWGIDLLVVSVDEGRGKPWEQCDHAKAYLEERGLSASYHCGLGKAGDVLLKTAREDNRDSIIIGGYAYNPFLGVLLGSTVDHILREFKQPVLVTR
ncbi:MAG: universal stress protein [Chloroflexi bacterium]|nr:MAG: universal stress protein [Chloroflexota bacterium]MBL1193624.1 universal stress protein [Chloroflexota bacterium]NOH10916.1 universal stress protein [Chloroflexota bacterium]